VQPLRLLVLLLIIGLSFAMPAFAGQLEDADAAYKRKNYDIALKLFRPLAEQGDAFAQCSLALMHEGGIGVQQDYAEAMKWYLKAADQGNTLAQYNLGVMYENQKNNVNAHKWYSLAAARSTDNNIRNRSAAGRDSVSAHMPPEQIAEAQKLSSEWKPSK